MHLAGREVRLGMTFADVKNRTTFSLCPFQVYMQGPDFHNKFIVSNFSCCYFVLFYFLFWVVGVGSIPHLSDFPFFGKKNGIFEISPIFLHTAMCVCC